jgi:uncharacterized protein (DUF4415 family)
MGFAARKRIASLSDSEEAAIRAGIAHDPDNPEWTDEDFALARPAKEVLPRKLYQALVRRSRGLREQEARRIRVSLRLDPDVVEKFRSTGPGWQGRVNEILRKAAGYEEALRLSS